MEWFQTLTPVDYGFLVVLLVGALFGWFKGLVEILTGFLAFVASFLIAGRYTGETVVWLNSRFGLEQRISAVIAAKLQPTTAIDQSPAVGTPLGNAAVEYIRALPLPDAYKVTLAQRVSREPALTQLSDVPRFIADQLAAGVLSTIVFLVMVAVLGALFVILGNLISKHIKEIPLVGTANRLLGSVLILVEILVVLAFIVGLLTPTLSLYGATGWMKAAEHAKLTPILLDVFTWARTFLFGLTRGTFFAA